MKLIDTTLREGEQFFRAYLTPVHKERIIRALHDIGIDEIELGHSKQEDLEALIGFARDVSSARLSVWTPLKDTFVKSAMAFDVDCVSIGVPVSLHHIQSRLGLTQQELLDTVESILKTASYSGGPEVALGLEDIGHANTFVLTHILALADTYNAARIRLSDSLGVMTPQSMTQLVTSVLGKTKCPVAVHCHNDFGMATANTIAAAEAGASWGDVSLLGMGERSGIALLEEVAAFFTLHRKTAQYNTRILPAVSSMVSGMVDLTIPRNKPVVGQDIFACESGIHVHGLLQDPALFEPFDPELVSRKRTIGIGKKSGRAAIRSVAASNSLISKNHLPCLVKSVRDLSAKLGRPLSELELSSLTAETPAAGAVQA